MVRSLTPQLFGSSGLLGRFTRFFTHQYASIVDPTVANVIIAMVQITHCHSRLKTKPNMVARVLGTRTAVPRMVNQVMVRDMRLFSICNWLL